MEKITHEMVDEWVSENGVYDAEGLLRLKLPGVIRKLNHADKQLCMVLEEIKTVFSDAEFYTSAGDQLCLVLGETHTPDRHSTAQQQRIAWGGKIKIGGGDW